MFWYRRRGEWHPIAERRIDYIFGRWQSELVWVNSKQLGFHHIRHTLGSLLEGRYGRAYKKWYLRHADGDVTDGYGVCTHDELAGT